MGNEQICNDIKSITSLKLAEELVCEECIKIDSRWVHLRTCQTCGKTLCCDSSPQKHMSAHFRKEGHPVVISSEPGERWLYCFVHDQIAEY
jgi:hypothetical protein